MNINGKNILSQYDTITFIEKLEEYINDAYVKRSVKLFETIAEKYNAKYVLNNNEYIDNYEDCLYNCKMLLEYKYKCKNECEIDEDDNDFYQSYYKWFIKDLLVLKFSDIDINRIVKFILHKNIFKLPSISEIKSENEEE